MVRGSIPFEESNCNRKCSLNRRYVKSVARCVLVLTLLPWLGRSAVQAAAWNGSEEPVKKFSSNHLDIFTDLDSREARRLAARLESTLRRIARYWGRSLTGRIECHIVDDVSSWSQADLPDPLTRILLQHLGGVTVPRTTNHHGRTELKGVIYAKSKQGIAEHEVVHAYCCQTFGGYGPDWYKEGMADVACHQNQSERAVGCPIDTIRFLRSGTPKSLDQIVSAGPFTDPLAGAIARIAKFSNKNESRLLAPMPTVWGAAEDDMLHHVKRSYSWSWALCHFLVNNRNYSDQFRHLGQGYLNGFDVDFDKSFSAVSQELTFEFEHFILNLNQGYRVDLCRWDWKKSFTQLSERPIQSIRIKAAAGYQPTGVIVAHGEEYVYRAMGTWTTRAGNQETTADGGSRGRGRLIGVVLKDFQLSEPFPLGESGTFVAPSTGRLFLRCRDHWNQLADNSGVVRVSLDRLRSREE